MLAQTLSLSFSALEKYQNFTQGTSSGPIVNSSNPFEFDFDGAGTNVSGYSISVVGPTGSSTFGGTLASFDGQFQNLSNGKDTSNIYGVLSGSGYTFGNGNYTIGVGPTGGTLTSATVGFTPTSTQAFPSTAPKVTNGVFSSGMLQVATGTSYTIDFNTSGLMFYTAGTFGGEVRLRIQDQDGNDIVDYSALETNGTTLPTSYTIAAGVLTAGEHYVATLEYDRLSDYQTSNSLLAAYGAPGAVMESLIGDDTTFTINAEAVPEPADYALIGSSLVFAGILVRRRLRRDKVASDSGLGFGAA